MLYSLTHSYLKPFLVLARVRFLNLSVLLAFVISLNIFNMRAGP